MKIEIITNDKGEVYTSFEPGGVATTHTKVCIIKRELGIDQVGIAPKQMWEELRAEYEVEVLHCTPQTNRKFP